MEQPDKPTREQADDLIESFLSWCGDYDILDVEEAHEHISNFLDEYEEE